MRVFRVAAALALATLTQVNAQTSAANNLNLGSFVKDGVYAIANQLGLFTQNNLTITYLNVPNSVAAYNNLLSGTYDILIGTFDNTINRDINGQPTYGLNFTVIAGLDNAPGLALWSTSAYPTPESLKGAVIGVDAVNSGYVYTLQKALALYGLQYPRDFSYSAVGSTPNRVSALQQGTIGATLFTYPYTELALVNNTQNLTYLIDIPTVIPQYQSGAVHVLTKNIQSNSTDLYDKYVRFLTVQLQARQILLDSTQNNNTQQEVLTALQTEFATDAAGAQKLYVDCFLAAGYFANTNLEITPTQAATTAFLRQQYGGFTSLGGNASSATDISKLIFNRGDGSIINYKVRDAALARLAALQ